MENYGMGALDVLGAIQDQDIKAQKAPAELAHMEALTRLGKANAGATELATRMQSDGLKAMEGFVFDKTNPSKSLLEMGTRLATSQPKVAEETFKAAGLYTQREAQAEALRVQTAERQNKDTLARIQAIYAPYTGITEQSEPAYDKARRAAIVSARSLGMPAEEIQQALTEAEALYRNGGALAIQPVLTAAASSNARLSQVLAEKKLALDSVRQAALEKQREEQNRLAQERLNLSREQGADRIKAGGGVAKPVKDPALKTSLPLAVLTAEGLVAADPELSRGDPLLQRNWANEIGMAAVRKIEASQAEHRRNPNVKIIEDAEAQRQALEDVKSRLKTDTNFVGRMTSGAVGTKPREPKPKAGAPTFKDFLEKARVANPGKTDGDIRKFWEQKYGE